MIAVVTLAEYIQKYSTRGACTCGQCVDALENPEANQPIGHTSDVFFFKVALVNSPTAEELRSVIKNHVGVFNQIDLFDGKEHSYIEIGAWVGDQGLALQLIGMGTLLGLWDSLTPNCLPVPEELKTQMAGRGMITLMPLNKG